MGFRKANSIGAATSTEKVKAYIAAGITAGYGCQLYYDAYGVATAINGAIDGTSKPGKYGIAQATYASAVTGTFITRGAATVVSGGTSGNLVTAISAAGVITDAAVSSDTGDVSLGVSTGASTLILY